MPLFPIVYWVLLSSVRQEKKNEVESIGNSSFSDSLVKRSRKLQQAIKQRRPSLPQSLPKHLSKSCTIKNIKIIFNHIDLRFFSVLITDTLPIHHSFLQVLNMLLGPLAIFTCGILLVMLGEVHHVRLIYTRLVDPSICCLLFISYIIMIYIPGRFSKLNFCFYSRFI